MNNKIQIEGFDKVQALIRKLPEKVKKREVIKVFRSVSESTLQAMRSTAPKSSKAHKRYTGVKKALGRRAKGSVPASDIVNYEPGHGRKSIRKKALTKSKDPMLAVGAHSFGKFDGYYMRNWVNKGTKIKSANSFVERAYQMTKGKVTKDTEVKVARLIQKQINKLNA